MREKHIVAFGGDGFLTDPKSKLSAKFILGLTGKTHPSICFVPTASGDSEPYIQSFQLRYTADICDASYLKLFDREVKDLREYLLSKDVIYVGGGNTANMLAIWRVHGVDMILREAYDSGTVLCGTSAGSLCWFEGGVTDSFGRDLAPLYDGLGFIHATNCPHYDSESLREPQYHKFIKEGLGDGYAADDGAALHFVNGEFLEAISSKPAARAFRVERDGVGIRQTKLQARFLG